MEILMTLFNKDHPVLQAVYDNSLTAFTKISDICEIDYAPPAILDHKGIPNRKDLNSWWRMRAIPASRQHLAKDFPYLDTPASLTELNMGLSLSDRYWITDSPGSQKWKDVNFFDNPFTEDLGFITLGEKQQSYDSSEDMYSPNATLNGDLRKKWTIQNGQRILLKSGSGPFYQEPYNEVVAAMLHKSLLSPHDFVPYSLNGRYCACPNMLKEDEELIPMYDILKSHKKPNHMNDYQFCISLCTGLDLPEKQVKEHFSKMFVCDFILANHDRHYRNFGLIRNVETLAYTRMAPIYDTGACLWHDAISLTCPADYAYTAKPFGRDGMQPKEQLGLFTEFIWFDESRLKGFTEKASAVLSENPLLPSERINRVMNALQANIDYVKEQLP